MKQAILAAAFAIAVTAPAFAQSASSSASSSSSDGQVSASSSPHSDANCRKVYLKPGESPPSNSVSSSVNAGGGKVSGSTTVDGVTTHTDSASGATSMSSSTANGRTVVTSSDGTCTVYIRPEKHRAEK